MASQNCLHHTKYLLLPCTTAVSFSLSLPKTFSWCIYPRTIIACVTTARYHDSVNGEKTHWDLTSGGNQFLAHKAAVLKAPSDTAQQCKSGSEEWSAKSKWKWDISEVTCSSYWHWIHAQNISINTSALACQCPKILQALARKKNTPTFCRT